MEHRIKSIVNLVFNSPNVPVDDYHRFPPSPYYKFLGLMAKEIRAQLIVELGVCGGGGSYHMAKLNTSAHVIGVDITREYPDNIAYIEKECPNWSFVRGDSLLLSKTFDRYTVSPIDFLFIDTTHTYDQTRWEFEAYQPLMSQFGLICMDDLNRVGVRRYWNELTLPKIEIPELHPAASPTDGSFGVVWGWK